MKQLIKKVPVPLSGVMLGCAALGNLLQSYSELVRWIFGIIATVLLLLMVLKMICYPKDIKNDLGNPIMASVAATFPMGLMLLSVYYKPYLGMVSMILWFAAIVLHLALIVYFTVKFILRPDIKKVFASYFIVYVGIAVAGITAPAYNMKPIGAAAFWFGFVSLLCLLVLIGYRYIKHSSMPEPAQPLFCIFAAPASLCLAAYLQSVEPKNITFVYVMLALSSILYIVSFIRLISMLRFQFYPSYAAFTFPFVISAIAVKQSNAFLSASENSLSFLPMLTTIETVIATVLVCYTLIRFVVFLVEKPSTATEKNTVPR